MMSGCSRKVPHSWSRDKLRPPVSVLPHANIVPCPLSFRAAPARPPCPNVTSSSPLPSAAGQIKTAFNLAAVPSSSSSSPQLEMTAFIFSVLDYFPRFHNSRHYFRAPDANLLRLLEYAVK